MILDCEFCPKVTQFSNRREAIDKGWNWQEGVANKETFTAAACPDCDESKVKEAYKDKSDAFTIESEPGEQPLAPKPNEKGLGVYIE